MGYPQRTPGVGPARDSVDGSHLGDGLAELVRELGTALELVTPGAISGWLVLASPLAKPAGLLKVARGSPRDLHVSLLAVRHAWHAAATHLSWDASYAPHPESEPMPHLAQRCP